MIAIIALVLIAIVALTLLGFALHLLFSPCCWCWESASWSG